MRVSHSIALWLILAHSAWAQFTSGWYPPTNAPIRQTDGTNWVWAKDLYRDELGKATLERMAPLGQSDGDLLAAPARNPWEHAFVQSCKDGLLSVVPSYLNLTYTNDAGIFIGYTNRLSEAYTNRFWTASNILVYCNLPADFWTNTPARYLHRGGNQLYGWEGVYRVVKALDYLESTAWYQESDRLTYSNIYLEALDESGDYCGVPIPTGGAPVDEPTPTNAIEVLYANLAGVSESEHWIIDPLYLFDYDYGTDTINEWWYSWQRFVFKDTPTEIRPGAAAPYFGLEDYHPTNSFDVQSFYRPDNASGSGTNYFAQVVIGGSNEYFNSIPAYVATNITQYIYFGRGTGTIVEANSYYAAVLGELAADFYGSPVTFESIYTNGFNQCVQYISDDNPGCNNVGDGSLPLFVVKNGLSEGIGGGLCQEDPLRSYTRFVKRAESSGYNLDSAIKWNWVYK